MDLPNSNTNICYESSSEFETEDEREVESTSFLSQLLSKFQSKSNNDIDIKPKSIPAKPKVRKTLNL